MMVHQLCKPSWQQDLLVDAVEFGSSLAFFTHVRGKGLGPRLYG